MCIQTQTAPEGGRGVVWFVLITLQTKYVSDHSSDVTVPYQLGFIQNSKCSQQIYVLGKAGKCIHKNNNVFPPFIIVYPHKVIE